MRSSERYITTGTHSQKNDATMVGSSQATTHAVMYWLGGVLNKLCPRLKKKVKKVHIVDTIPLGSKVVKHMKKGTTKRC